MTNAIWVTRTGGPEVLEWRPVETGSPGAGEVLVRHTAVGLNFIDTYHRSGLYKLPSLPHVLGVEAAGVVEDVGSGAHVSVGDRVAYVVSPPGAYSERRIVPADRVVRLPDDIDDEAAAASMLKGMTAEFLLRRTYRVQHGDWVLLHAAAGGVGSIATQWLAHLGARVIGTVSTEEKAEYARSQGCEFPIVYTREDFVEKVREITDGRGVDVVYDSVGKTTFARSLTVLRPRGILVGFGNASGKPGPVDPLLLASHGSLYMTRPTLFDYIRSRADLVASASSLFHVLSIGAVRIDVGQRYPLAEAARAHEALEARTTTGSTVLIP